MTAHKRPRRPFPQRWANRLEPLFRHPLTILGVAAVAAWLCGLVLNPRGLALAAGLLCVMALGIAWPWISLRGLQGTLSFEKSRGREGQPLAARLTFRNRAPWAAWGLALRFGPDSQFAATHLALSHLPGGAESHFDWTFTPDRRGEHPDRAWVASGFPFGLRESARSLAVEKPVLVWPLLFPVGPVPEEAGGDDSDGSSLRDRPGDAGDLLGVRFYRRGDPLRRVHWGQTARHGELIVCERQSASSPRVQIVLDTDPAAHHGTGPQGSLEWAIRVAASLLDDWIGQGAETELLYADRAVPSAGRHSPSPPCIGPRHPGPARACSLLPPRLRPRWPVLPPVRTRPPRRRLHRPFPSPTRPLGGRSHRTLHRPRRQRL